MPVRSERSKLIYETRAFAKRKVYRKVTIAGTDVSNDVESIALPLTSASRVGGFDIALSNDNGKYTGTFTKNSIVKVWINYTNNFSGDPMFEGRLETSEYDMENSGAFFLIITGRDYMGDADRLVFEDFSATPTAGSEVVKYLRDKYAPSHSDNNDYIDTIETTISPSWNGRPLLACVQDVIEDTGNKHTFRTDVNKVWHLREKGTVDSGLAIVYQGNMTSMKNVDGSLASMKNRVWVTGKSTAGAPLIHRADNATSQSSYKIREMLKEDSNLITLDQVKNRAIQMNSISSSMEQRGTTGSYGLPTLVPGQDILLLNPFCKADGKRTVIDVTQTLNVDGFRTWIAYEEAEKTMIDRVIDREKLEQERLTIDNFFGMTRCHVMEFKDENYGTSGTSPNSSAALESMTRCVVWEDVLMMQLLETDGNCESRVHETDTNIMQIVPKVIGSNLKSDEGKVWLRLDVSANGSDYDTLGIDALYNVPENWRGKHLKARLYFTSLITKIKAVSLMYKRVGD